MKIFLVAAVMLCALPCFAQDAKVVQLDAKDAADAKQKWEALQLAQAQWDVEKEVLRQKYTLVESDDPDKGTAETSIGTLGLVFTTTCGTGGDSCFTEEEKKERQAERDAHERWYRKGFEWGFDLTDDFKFLVPKHLDPVKPNWGGNGFIAY